MSKLKNLDPNVCKLKLTSNGCKVEWLNDGRRIITYSSKHKYCEKLGVNLVEIIP